jgi:hypothetical protein
MLLTRLALKRMALCVILERLKLAPAEQQFARDALQAHPNELKFRSFS